MDRRIAAFEDELEKIAVSIRMSHFIQTRKGRRPIRVGTLLKKESTYEHPEDETRKDDDRQPEPHEVEVEGGRGLAEGPVG